MTNKLFYYKYVTIGTLYVCYIFYIYAIVTQNLVKLVRNKYKQMNNVGRYDTKVVRVWSLTDILVDNDLTTGVYICIYHLNRVTLTCFNEIADHSVHWPPAYKNIRVDSLLYSHAKSCGCLWLGLSDTVTFLYFVINYYFKITIKWAIHSIIQSFIHISRWSKLCRYGGRWYIWKHKMAYKTSLHHITSTPLTVI